MQNPIVVPADEFVDVPSINSVPSIITAMPTPPMQVGTTPPTTALMQEGPATIVGNILETSTLIENIKASSENPWRMREPIERCVAKHVWNGKGSNDEHKCDLRMEMNGNLDMNSSELAALFNLHGFKTDNSVKSAQDELELHVSMNGAHECLRFIKCMETHRNH